MVICKPSRVPHFLGARRDHSAHARQEIEDGRGLLPGGLEPAAEDDVPELAFPAHFDAEVLAALGRLHRAGDIDAGSVARGLEALAQAPFTRHPLSPLLAAAWSRRGETRLVDALYVALAVELLAQIVTLDRGLAVAAPRAELLETDLG